MFASGTRLYDIAPPFNSYRKTGHFLMYDSIFFFFFFFLPWCFSPLPPLTGTPHSYTGPSNLEPGPFSRRFKWLSPPDFSLLSIFFFFRACFPFCLTIHPSLQRFPGDSLRIALLATGLFSSHWLFPCQPVAVLTFVGFFLERSPPPIRFFFPVGR